MRPKGETARLYKSLTAHEAKAILELRDIAGGLRTMVHVHQKDKAGTLVSQFALQLIATASRMDEAVDVLERQL